jgi:hypothetical protein
MGDSFFEVEHRPNGEVVIRFKSPNFPKMSDEAKHRLMTTKKDVLVAIRKMVDKAIEKTDEQAKPKGKKAKTKIEVK